MNFCRLGIGHRREVRTDVQDAQTHHHVRGAHVAALPPRRGARRRRRRRAAARAALRRAPLEPPSRRRRRCPSARPACCPWTRSRTRQPRPSATSNRAWRRSGTAPPPPSDLRARLTALKAAKAEAPAARENFYESAGFCPAPADEPAAAAPADRGAGRGATAKWPRCNG